MSVLKIFDEHQLEYVLMARGESDDVYMVGKIAAFQIQNLLVAYKERFDKDNLFKNLLSDNLLLVDIYNRAKKLHIDTEVRRVIFIIETKHEKDSNTLDNVRGMLATARDFVTAVDEKNIIVVKELEPSDGYPEVDKTAQNLYSLLKEEEGEDVLIAYGTIVGDIKEVIKVIQGSQAGAGRGQDLCRGEKRDCLQCFGDRTIDLSTADSAL